VLTPFDARCGRANLQASSNKAAHGGGIADCIARPRSAFRKPSRSCRTERRRSPFPRPPVRRDRYESHQVGTNKNLLFARAYNRSAKKQPAPRSAKNASCKLHPLVSLVARRPEGMGCYIYRRQLLHEDRRFTSSAFEILSAGRPTRTSRRRIGLKAPPPGPPRSRSQTLLRSRQRQRSDVHEVGTV
jgi:hypothetical protein